MSEAKRTKPKNLKVTAVRLLGRILKYKFHFVAACLCMAVGSAATVRGTYYLKPMVDDYFVPLIGQIAKDSSFSSAFSAYLNNGDNPLKGAAGLILLMTGCYLVSMLAALGESQLMASLGSKVLFDLRVELFDRLLKQPLGAIESKSAGAIMSSFTNDMDSLANMLRRSLPYMVNGTVTCITIMVIMLKLHVGLTLVILAVVALMIPLLNWMAKKSMIHTAATQACLMELNSVAGEYSQSQELIRTLGMEETARKRFEDRNAALFEHTYRVSTFNNGIFSVTNGINQLGYAIVLLAGAAMALAGAVDVGTVALFSQYYTQFYKPLTDMTKQVSNILSALAGAERIFDVMDVPPEIDEGTATLELQKDGSYAWVLQDEKALLPDNNHKIVPFKGEISLDHIVFGYVPGRKVLKDITLDIKPGETVAVLGTTGAGKTTVISLLNRLYEIWEGSLLFDGIPMNEISKKSLRLAVATVSQDTHLFTGTVADNLRFGRPGATDEELWEAARQVGADFLISHLPKGMNTLLEKGGETLSQGERQLLSVTRAAVADAPVLILDEATSSIDTYTEKKISEAFDKLMAGRTVLVIAHRLSTVQNADRIVILDDGRIAEVGTKEELIRQKGFYYRLLHADEELA